MSARKRKAVPGICVTLPALNVTEFWVASVTSCVIHAPIAFTVSTPSFPSIAMPAANPSESIKVKKSKIQYFFSDFEKQVRCLRLVISIGSRKKEKHVRSKPLESFNAFSYMRFDVLKQKKGPFSFLLYGLSFYENGCADGFGRVIRSSHN